MMRDRFSVVSAVLAADVANSGTFTVGYPSGKSQNSFNRGLAAANGYAMIDDNDKWNEADTKVSFTFGASLITVTNLSGVTWRAGQKVSLYIGEQDGNDVLVITIPVKLAAITANGDVATEIRPGVYGWIEDAEFVVTQPVTTAAKLATLNFEIGTTNVTGGTIALTSAAATPLGKSIPAAAITGNNRLTPDSLLSLEASGVTAFSEGEGFVLLRIRKDPAYR